MKPFELAISSYLFNRVVDFNKSFLAFQEAVGDQPDLSRPEHREALLKWLNKWGCRQFARNHHPHASSEIAVWHGECAGLLPSVDADLPILSEGQLGAVADAYKNLAERTASFRDGVGPVLIGPTGAAKILFALRPKALPPWDEPIRKELEYDGSSESYFRYLKHTQMVLADLAIACEQRGFCLADLPAKIGRPMVTLPKLIDEYYWITITRRVLLPSPETVREWLALAGSSTTD